MTIICPKSDDNMVRGYRAEPGHSVETDDFLLAKRAADTLHQHYPGHLWAVNVNSEGGIMIIKNYRMSFSYGMVLHLKNVYQDPTLKTVIRKAGEFLERANLKRGKYNGDQAEYIDGVAKQHQPKNGMIF